jgi:hypothetical protein
LLLPCIRASLTGSASLIFRIIPFDILKGTSILMHKGIHFYILSCALDALMATYAEFEFRTRLLFDFNVAPSNARQVSMGIKNYIILFLCAPAHNFPTRR